MSARCVIVGAGVIGASVAYRLVQAGARVTLVDAHGPAAGTSGTSFAWVGASASGLRDYFEINAAGVAGHRRLRVELGSAPWLHDFGCLQWSGEASAANELAQRVRELRATGYPAVLLPREQAAALEPDVRFGNAVEAVALYPDEGFVFPALMIAHLLRASREGGLAERYGERVSALAEGGGVVLESGERVPADIVVLCCGRWITELASGVPIVAGTKSGSPAVGLLVRTAPVAVTLERMLYVDEIMIRPDGGGRLLLRSDALDSEVDPGVEPSSELTADLAAEASLHLLLRSEPRLESAQVGIRALTADLLPAVGWLPGPGSVYACVTHSGVTLAPILGELVASEVLKDDDQPLLTRFRPTRFAQRRDEALTRIEA